MSTLVVAASSVTDRVKSFKKLKSRITLGLWYYSICRVSNMTDLINLDWVFFVLVLDNWHKIKVADG